MTEGGAKLMGGTMVPNIVLWPSSALFVAACVTISGFIYQDRERLSVQERINADQAVSISTNRKDIDNLMSMWNTVNRKMDEIDRKMDRLMP